MQKGPQYEKAPSEFLEAHPPSSEKLQSIGRFFYDFSYLEFTIKFLLSKVARMDPQLFDTLTGPLDFAVACTSLHQAAERMCKPEEAAALKRILNRCRTINDERVRMAHGFWMVDADGDVYARHVARSSLAADKHFAGQRTVETLSEKALDLQGDLMDWYYAPGGAGASQD